MSDRAVESVDYAGDPEDDPACMLVQPGAQPHLLLGTESDLVFRLCLLSQYVSSPIQGKPPTKRKMTGETPEVRSDKRRPRE